MRHCFRRFAGGAPRAAAVIACLLLVLAAIAHTAPAQAPTSAPVAHFYNSLRGVHIAGYQGWFNCPNDGAGIGWGHWFRGGADPRNPDSLAIDMWPDTSELGPDELCPTGFRLPSGAPAYLFSDHNPKTVARHFLWMRQYGLDGVAMQRFTAAVAQPAIKAHFDTVLRSAKAAAENNRRGFFVMYDISGTNGAVALSLIERDWPHLIADLHLADSPSYIYDRGKPVVGVWGLGFSDRNVSPEQAAAIIRYLKTAPVPATVLGGVPASWRNLNADGRWPDSRTEPGWRAVYRSLDIISPWAAGRFRDDQRANEFAHLRIAPDLAETRRLRIEYMPVVFPGFSWHGVTRSMFNLIPRRCGAFYRRQIDNAVRAGAEMLYTAMFDEFNEGTAISKAVAHQNQQPEGTNLLALDADGCHTATSDMYLRIAGEATRELKRVP